jgi:hypothetical protein
MKIAKEQEIDAEETGFDKEMVLEFYKRGGKMLSRFKEGKDTGKYILPNRTEDVDKIVEGMPYRCMVKNPDDCGAAFAKIISQVYIPRIIVRKGFVIITLKGKGKDSKVEHVAVPSLRTALQTLIEKGIYRWLMIIQTNDFSDDGEIGDIDVNKFWVSK